MKRSPKLCSCALLLAAAFWMLLGGAAHYSLIDDLQWGTQTGLDWWRYGLLNSRYVGNLLRCSCAAPLRSKPWSWVEPCSSSPS